MDLEKTKENSPEDSVSNPAAEEPAVPVTEEAVSPQGKEPKKQESTPLWNPPVLILYHLLLAIFIVGSIYWLVDRHEYRAEHVVAAPGGDPVQIYCAPDDNAAKAAANYLAYAMEETLGLETALITEQAGEFRGVSVLCGPEISAEPEQKATIVFAAAAMPANAAEDALGSAVYRLQLGDDGVHILVPDRENCFGAVKAVTDRWLQTDCGVTGDGDLVISQAMIDRQLSNLPTEVSGQIRILTQNLRNQDDGEGKTVEERSKRFFQLVDDYKPDLIGTQEATWEWMQLLEEGLSDRYELFGCSRLGPNTQDGEWNTILYRKDRFTAIGSDNFWLSNTPSEAASKLNYEGAVRICTWALLQDTETGKTVLFSNTHLQNTINKADVYREVRERQAEILLQKLRSNGNMLAQYPGFLTGDFNGQYSEPFYSVVTTVYEDAHTSAINDTSPVSYSFHNYGRAQQLYDYCFHSQKNVTILDYRILDDQYDGYISDHYGILVTAVIR